MWIDWIFLPVVLALALFFVVRHFWNQSQGKVECKSCKNCENADACLEIFEMAEQPEDGAQENESSPQPD